ncbi:hypothetical protein [Paraburkholderia phenoliruptrix]|uniref:hypothetical protein n=1 Tax=Paraburkholderia phenoliruptrix TaxID=252970 RepID=UPI001C4E4EBE|nr:hypothetical protein [Paraburkholderia phenoliruptrix]MBW0450863.1 hypothetical protein [Paraburkholderia phenoliruptrix]MBW9100956.1 hypothetical protein [Paraburkholderia phenoliruptrix]
MGKRWSPEEKAILTKIWRSPRLLKTQMDLLPGRTYDTAIQHATKVLKLGPKCPPASQVFRLADALMDDKKVRSIKQISDLTGRSLHQIRIVLNAAVDRGEYRIVRWHASASGGELQAFYKKGKGPSKPRPARLTPAERSRRFRERLGRKKYKAWRSKYRSPQAIALPRDELMDALYGRREYAQVAA